MTTLSAFLPIVVARDITISFAALTNDGTALVKEVINFVIIPPKLTFLFISLKAFANDLKPPSMPFSLMPFEIFWSPLVADCTNFLKVGDNLSDTLNLTPSNADLRSVTSPARLSSWVFAILSAAP